jgi:hypothetical protein
MSDMVGLHPFCSAALKKRNALAIFQSVDFPFKEPPRTLLQVSQVITSTVGTVSSSFIIVVRVSLLPTLTLQRVENLRLNQNVYFGGLDHFRQKRAINFQK